MKHRTLALDALGVVLFLLALAGAGLASSSCAGPSPWLRPQGELLQLERQAAAALDLASDPRTRGALGLCIASGQGAVRAIDTLLQRQEQLRQARKAGAAIPELERSVARATTDAEDAEAQARTDCRRAGVSRAPARAPAADGGAVLPLEPADGGAAADLGSAPAAAPARDLAPSSSGTSSPGTLPSPHQPPTTPAPADGGAR